jgi:hypothetical protein
MAAYTERIVSPAHRPVLPATNSATNSVHAVTERLGAEPVGRSVRVCTGRPGTAARAEERKNERPRTKRDAGYPARAAPVQGPQALGFCSVRVHPAGVARGSVPQAGRPFALFTLRGQLKQYALAWHEACLSNTKLSPILTDRAKMRVWLTPPANTHANPSFVRMHSNFTLLLQ